MGFFDRVGDAWDWLHKEDDKIPNAPSIGAVTHGIGSAFTAATNSGFADLLRAGYGKYQDVQQSGFGPDIIPGKNKENVGQLLFNVAASNPLTSTLASNNSNGVNATDIGLKAINLPFSYGVARPLSTALQVDTNGDYLSASAWSTAWNRSADISLGQAADINLMKMFGGADNLGDDPFDKQHAAQRQHLFYDTWGGRLSSGAIDATVGFVADPIAVVGKAGKAIGGGASIIKGADRADVLSSLRPAVVDPTIGRAPTSEEQAAVKQYIGIDHKYINPDLRSGKPLEKNHAPVVQHLDTAIAEGPPLRQDTTVWRGTTGAKGNDIFGPGVKAGDIVSSKGYLSTSKQETGAHQFLKTGPASVVEINVPAGARHLDVNAALGRGGKTIGDPNFHSLSAENEIILPRDAKLRVDSIDENASIPDSLDPSGTRQVRKIRASVVLDPADIPTKVPLGSKTKAPGAGFNLYGQLNNAASNPVKQADKVKGLVDKILNTRVGLIPDMPELSDHADAGAFAQLVQRARDENPDDLDEQRQAVVDVLGTAWGDQTSMDNLVAKRAALAGQMQRLSNAPLISMADRKAIEDATKGLADPSVRAQMFADAQEAASKELTGKQEAIDKAIQAINRNVAAKQTLRPRLAAGALERASHSRFSQTILHDGVAGPVTRVVAGQTADRLPGHVNVKDVTAGYSDMKNYLTQSSLDGPQKRKLLDDFVLAGSSGERQSIVKKMNALNVKAAGAKYGLSSAEIEQLLKDGDDTVNYIRSAISTRLYSAGAGNVGIYDPDEDIYNVFDHPIAKSQIEDMHYALDPKALDKTFKRLTDSGYLGPRASGNVEIAKEGMAFATRRWKDAALIRGAYPLRIMTDSNLRLMLHMDFLQFAGTRWTGLKGVSHYLLTQTDKDGVTQGAKSLKNFFKPGDMEGALRKTLKLSVDPKHPELSLADDDIEKIVRTIISTDGSMADLANEVSTTQLSKIRSGDWRVIAPPNGRSTSGEMGDYLSAYQRVINQQIQNSPALRQLLLDDPETVKAMVEHQMVHGGRLADEWREVRDGFDDMDEWLGQGEAMVDHYVPTDDFRHQLWGSEADGSKPGHVTEDSLRHTFFGDDPVADAPDVHGEMYHVEKQGLVRAAYNRKRNGWFKMAAEMPESVMARAPLFWDSYRKSLAQQIEGIPEDALTPELIDQVRKNGIKQARRDIGKVLFDSSDVSNLSHTLRFVSPFFAAWEDTMKKYSKLVYDSPEFLSRLNQAAQSPNDAGMVVDSNGNRVNAQGQTFGPDGLRITDPNYDGDGQYVLLPSKLTSWLPGPLGGTNTDKYGRKQSKVSIRKDSINSVFQGEPWWLPGFGPTVQVPANYVVRQMFPKEADDPIMKYVLPYGTTTDSVQDQLLPKWAKTAKNVFGDTQDFNAQYGIFLAEAVIDNDHQPLTAKQLDKVKNKTRNYFILKAGVDNLSPVSIQPDSKYQFYIDQAHQYRSDPARQKADPAKGYTGDWLQDFNNDFPGFGEMAYSLSANNTGINAYDSAYDASKKYRQDIAKDPSLGWLFVGPANAGKKFSNGVYDWQMTNTAGGGKNFRGKKDPLTAITDLQAEQGWQQWNAFNTGINLELKRRGLYSTAQKGAEDLQAYKSAVRSSISADNPAWADSQATMSQGGAGRLISAAQDFMGVHKDVADRSDMRALQQYIAVRTAVKFELSQRDNKSLQYNPDLQAALEGTGQSLADANIGFEAMWNRSLQYDDLTDIKVAPSA